MGSLPQVVEDCMGVLQLFSDGTIFRSNDIDFKVSAIQDDSVVLKESVFDKKHNLYLRVYKPKSPSSLNHKLPVLIFFHGGGFCVGSCLWPNVNNVCVRLASALEAVVVSTDYRLAPEYRLPAAMEDAMVMMRWLQRQASSESEDEEDEEGRSNSWLRGNGIVDFDRVFLVGDSSGGNIAHHLAVQLGSGSRDMAPVRVRGYVLLAPFFGGEVRTKSEQGPSEQMLTLDALDRFWRLSLPAGENRDHPFANPFGRGSPSLGAVNLDPILVIAGGDELMKDRIADYAERLKQLGKDITYIELPKQQHGFFTDAPHSEHSFKLMQLIKNFMLQNSVC